MTPPQSRLGACATLFCIVACCGLILVAALWEQAADLGCELDPQPAVAGAPGPAQQPPAPAGRDFPGADQPGNVDAWLRRRPAQAPIRAPVGQGRPLREAAAATPHAGLLTPWEQNAAKKELVEGHWLGVEVIPLLPELAELYKVPPGEQGVLVDEITLEGAESGLLAGDLIQRVAGRPTADLRAFFLATQEVQGNETTRVAVNRQGKKMSFVLEARNTDRLGFAQMEAASPIKPGAPSPHRDMKRACTDCHVVMKSGGQLPIDGGDLVPAPPAIARDAVSPHAERGTCAACHVTRPSPGRAGPAVRQ